MSKYIIWKSSSQGEYVKADEVQDDGDTVSFFLNKKLVRKEKLKDIEGYSKADE